MDIFDYFGVSSVKISRKCWKNGIFGLGGPVCERLSLKTHPELSIKFFESS